MAAGEVAMGLGRQPNRWIPISSPRPATETIGVCHANTAALTDASVTTTGAPENTAPATFPPTDIDAFLSCCAGEWLSLRSRFNLDPGTAASKGAEASEAAMESADDNSWHASERAELKVTRLAALGGGHGGLAMDVKDRAGIQRAYFHADGSFGSQPDAGQGETGTWTLGPDGCLDLVINQGERQLRERIWFTKPNLRLRSTVEQLASGSPGRASFSSEIRRVPRPAEPAARGQGLAPAP